MFFRKNTPYFRANQITYGLALICIISIIISILLLYLFPLSIFPEPTGYYEVGTTSLHLVDRSRLELCDSGERSYRELMAQIWYPSERLEGEKALYLKDQRLVPHKLPFIHLGLVRTNSVENAPAARIDPSYPVILYSPSWNGYRTENTFLSEELASHGFIVIALEHPCAVPLAIYPSGKIVRGNLPAPDYTSSDQALINFLRLGDEQVLLRTQDIIFVINELSAINEGKIQTPLTHLLALDRMGIFGYSFGGAVAAESCFQDGRLKAGLNMDGLLFGRVAEEGTSQPFFFMNSDYPRPTFSDLNSSNGTFRRDSEINALGYERMDNWIKRYGGYYLTLLNSSHVDFSDTPLRSRLRTLKLNNHTPAIRSSKILSSYVVAFFREYLQDFHSSLLDDGTNNIYPEVSYRHYTAIN
ncbi:MAG: hypothetical protein N5P05_000079 [Chroococcopsis gigantea SAG 12.99]|jgi:hypothetical protein|nr:hypothetical protein [Chroococcopsis gigantea SAG 12.99]